MALQKGLETNVPIGPFIRVGRDRLQVSLFWISSWVPSPIQTHSSSFSGESNGHLLPKAGSSQQAWNWSLLRVNMEKLLTVLTRQ